MKKIKNKGFTLIELLAVIIIIAIISLIAMPIVANVISKSNSEANKTSAENILNSAVLFYGQQKIKNEEQIYDFVCNNSGCSDGEKSLSYKGKNPDEGNIRIDLKGTVEGYVIFGKDKFYYQNSRLVLEKIPNNSSIYSWDDGYFTDLYIDDTLAMLNQLNVKRVYHYFDDLNDDFYKEIVTKLHKNGQDVYHLTGDPTWYSDPNKIKENINSIQQYNQNNPSNKIRGIVLDIEFYLNDTWDTDKNGIVNTMVQTYQTVITYAHQYDIEVILCLPYWLDSDFASQLEQLIKISDGVSIMNYNQKILKKGIEKEIEFAKKYEKAIDNISEFNPLNEGEENLTFWEDGIPKALDDWENLAQEFDYQRLTFSFHDLKSLLVLQKNYNYYEFTIHKKNGSIQKNSDMIFKVTVGKKVTYLTRNSKDDGSIKVILPKTCSYDIFSDDYQINSISNIVESNNQKQATITLGDAKTRYTGEIYFKYWNTSKNGYSSLKNTSVTLRSLETNKEYTKTTDSSDGYAIFNLKHGDSYQIKINDGKSYNISFGAEDSNKDTFSYQASDGTYLTPKIYLKEK